MPAVHSNTSRLCLPAQPTARQVVFRLQWQESSQQALHLWDGKSHYISLPPPSPNIFFCSRGIGTEGRKLVGKNSLESQGLHLHCCPPPLLQPNWCRKLPICFNYFKKSLCWNYSCLLAETAGHHCGQAGKTARGGGSGSEDTTVTGDNFCIQSSC